MMPRVLPFDHPETVLAVAAALETGETIIFPTETVYGIGGNPWDERTVARVRRLKDRPADAPFTLHLPDVTAIARYATLDSRSAEVAARLLPGPYTLLLRATDRAPASAVRDGVIGIRVPDHPFFGSVIARLDRPVFGTSVNRHGEPPLNDIDRIIDRFSGVGLVVVGPVAGTPSTILDLAAEPPRVVRGQRPPAFDAILGDDESSSR